MKEDEWMKEWRTNQNVMAIIIIIIITTLFREVKHQALIMSNEWNKWIMNNK